MKHRTYVIAEMACSHEGRLDLAKKIIDGAGLAEADAIQFQIYERTERATPFHPDFELLGDLELSRDEWRELAHYARHQYPLMEIIACVYEPGSVDFAETLPVDAYKLHSADLSNPRLIELVAQTGRRIDLSVGASTLDEISSAIATIKRISDASVCLMYGMQNFPTPTDEVHLDYMMKLKELFELPIGYQDHTDADTEAAFWLPAAALGLGVDLLEKHITHDRTYRGVDHQAALDPGEFGRFVQMVRQIEAARGSGIPKPFTAEEMKYRRYAKKSVVAAEDIPLGTRLKEGHFKFMFANDTGLPPDQADRLIGKEVAREIPAYTLIGEGDVR